MGGTVKKTPCRSGDIISGERALHKQPGGQSFDEDRSGAILFVGQSFGRYGRIISGEKKTLHRESSGKDI